MRICYAIQTFLPARMTGPIRHVEALSRGLATRGHDVRVITSRADVSPETPPDTTVGDVTIRRLRVSHRLGHWIRCPDLKSELLDGHFDVVHVMGYRNYFSEVVSATCRNRSIPVVITPMGSLLGYRHLDAAGVSGVPNVLFDLLTQRRALQDAVIVTTSSQEAAEAYSLGLLRAQVRIIPHGLDFARLPGSPARGGGNGNRLLFVGRIAEPRNIQFLLRGFALALRIRPDLMLSIVGDAIPGRHSLHQRTYPERVRKTALELGINDNVDFCGGLYGESLWRAYANHDLFVFSSRYENFGYMFVEAAYFGLPIISTPVGVAPELIRDNQGGILVEHDDDRALGAAILKSASDSEWRLGASDFARYQSRRYGLNANLDAHESLHQSLRR